MLSQALKCVHSSPAIKYGIQDLDDTGRIRDIIAKGSRDYAVLSHDKEIQSLSRIKYRNKLREAIYDLADRLVEN